MLEDTSTLNSESDSKQNSIFTMYRLLDKGHGDLQVEQESTVRSREGRKQQGT